MLIWGTLATSTLVLRPMTIEAWVNSRISGWQDIVTTHANSDETYWLRLNSTAS